MLGWCQNLRNCIHNAEVSGTVKSNDNVPSEKEINFLNENPM